MGSGMAGEYDQFRAVHDTLGHARLGSGFDRHAEFTVWLWQERVHSPLPRRALATELQGQHSVLWTTGRWPSPRWSSSTRGCCSDLVAWGPPELSRTLLGYRVLLHIDPQVDGLSVQTSGASRIWLR